MLKKVIRPNKEPVYFTYDALGRRLTKTYKGSTTHFVWDGNTLLHQWTTAEDQASTYVDEEGKLQVQAPENLITWIFEEGTFVPQAKLVDGKSYSIITDHLGTPFEAFDEQGKKVWQCQLDIYGKIRKIVGVEGFVPLSLPRAILR